MISETDEDPQEEAGERRIRRRRKYRRLLVGMILVGCTLPMMLVVAPLQTRWLTAVAMKQFYAVIDGRENIVWNTASERGLDPQGIGSRLAAENGGKWNVVFANPDLSRDLRNFAHEDPQHPSVVAFRKATADLVPETFDVFEVARRVRRLTNHRTDFSGHEIWDCLAAARSGRGLWCHQFCRLFAAVCSSRGYTTRMVSLSCRGNHFDHAMCEIYLPDMGGWTLIDVDFEIAYRAGDRWLTAIELQQIWKSVRDDVPFEKRFEDTSTQAAKRRDWIAAKHELEIIEFGSEEMNLRAERFRVSPTSYNLELFEYVFLAVRDDYLSETYPFAHPFRIGQICFRADESEDLIEVCPEAHYAMWESVYAQVGRSHVEAISVHEGPSLQLRFTSSMPNAELFQVRHNSGDWQIVKNPQLEAWALMHSVNTLEVRAVNSQGVGGPVTAIQIKGG